MEREIMELKSMKSWICECGVSNPINDPYDDTQTRCRSCHKNRYPKKAKKRINCPKCSKIIMNPVIGETCKRCDAKIEKI